MSPPRPGQLPHSPCPWAEHGFPLWEMKASLGVWERLSVVSAVIWIIYEVSGRSAPRAGFNQPNFFDTHPGRAKKQQVGKSQPSPSRSPGYIAGRVGSSLLKDSPFHVSSKTRKVSMRLERGIASIWPEEIGAPFCQNLPTFWNTTSLTTSPSVGI